MNESNLTKVKNMGLDAQLVQCLKKLASSN